MDLKKETKKVCKEVLEAHKEMYYLMTGEVYEDD